MAIEGQRARKRRRVKTHGCWHLPNRRWLPTTGGIEVDGLQRGRRLKTGGSIVIGSL